MQIDPFTIKSLINNIESRVSTFSSSPQYEKPSSWRKTAYSMVRKEFFQEERSRKGYETKKELHRIYQNESDASGWSRAIDNLVSREFIDHERERQIRLICMKFEAKVFNIDSCSLKTNLKRRILTLHEREEEEVDTYSLVSRYLVARYKKVNSNRELDG